MSDSITQLSGWQLKTLILSIIVSATGYLIFSLWSGWEDVRDAFSQIGLLGTLIALSLSLTNYGLRFIRWQLYLAKLGYRIDVLSSLRIYLSGFSLTTTPGKAGETFRGILLKQHNIPFSTTLVAFFSERLSDLVAIVLLTLIGLSQYPQAQGMVFAGGSAIVLLLASMSNNRALNCIHSWAYERKGKVFRLFTQIIDLLKETKQCHTLGMLIFSTIISVIAWGAEAFAFYLLLQWLGADIGFSFAIFVYALSMLAGALSFLPGGIGSAEVVMISLLVTKGMTLPAAIAATVFIRLVTLWFAVLIGLVALYHSSKKEAI
ncbi:lysylphosphatidylglycerol synthase transmembrane domain-containing protein [Psychrobacter aquimaris]|uniref:lysylphosphatidylglycerol synthase transmembrane domain-containing protein n=1 Tax=Psychrobacter aquimaris TaxID=292733 RepID=UPI0039C65B67